MVGSPRASILGAALGLLIACPTASASDLKARGPGTGPPAAPSSEPAGPLDDLIPLDGIVRTFGNPRLGPAPAPVQDLIARPASGPSTSVAELDPDDPSLLAATGNLEPRLPIRTLEHTPRPPAEASRGAAGKDPEVPIGEPTSLVLLLTGLVGLWARHRLRGESGRIVGDPGAS